MKETWLELIRGRVYANKDDHCMKLDRKFLLSEVDHLMAELRESALQYLHADTARSEAIEEREELRAENARLREDTARRCAEIAETGERYGVCPSCAIRREFGLEAKSE